MTYNPRYDRGDWKAVCESCGRLVKASSLQKRWDGYMVDERCWETRQPQDFVRGVADYQAPPFTRPEQSDQFIPTEYIYTPDGTMPIQPVITTGKTTLTMVVTRV
jgi:hypothetical protein